MGACPDALRSVGATVAGEHGLPLIEAKGEAAFYGPLLHLQVHNPRGHVETIATVQLDFNQLERLDLTFIGEESTAHRVVMIHRGTVGSMERVTGALLEHYQGRAPVLARPHPDGRPPGHPGPGRPGPRALRTRRRPRPARQSRPPRKARPPDPRRPPRREYLIAVLGETEAATRQVQVTDPAMGLRGHLDQQALVEVMADAHRSRTNRPTWLDPE
jgi:threonyl-tRNA synthetase